MTPPARLPLLCFPPAGGGAAFFRGWQQRLGAQVAIKPVVAPGREARWREPACTSAEELVRAVIPQLEPHVDRPFAVFGHSLGALVAYDVCRRLMDELGRAPVRLFVSARCAPHQRPRYAPLHTLPAAQFVDRIAGLNGIPPEVLAHRGLMEAVLPALRADLQVNETYPLQPPRPLPVVLTAMVGAADPLIRPHEMLGWDDATTAGFRLRVFDGDHFYLRDASPGPLAVIRSELEAALATRSHEVLTSARVAARPGHTVTP